MSDNYAKRGVSAGKEDVHFAIKNLDKGLFPNAFCKIMPDLVAGDEAFANIMHADGAGTKASLAYLYWKETGDVSVWKGIAQDGIVMNTDDMLCAGATQNFLFSNTIGRNKFLVSRDVLATVLNGMEEFFDMLRSYGIEMVSTGGETADVGDLVRTLIYDATAFARLPRNRVVTNENIRPGSVIIGLSSTGKAVYESEYNSGIGSNGLTNGRHDMLSHEYAAKYPETFDAAVDDSLVYAGPHKVTDIHAGSGLPIGKLLLSPTRTYLPVMKKVFESYFDKIHGMIHCTGGGQTKVMKFVSDLHVVKNELFPVPPLFEMIQSASGASWKEMYQVFNMGHRLEVYTDAETAKAVIDMAGEFEIEAKVVGHCHAAKANKLTLNGSFGELTF